MKKILLLLLLSALSWTIFAQQTQKNGEKIKITDFSASNNSLVVIWIQIDELGMFKQKVGPGHLNFVKVLPEIGPLFTPDRSKSNNLLFYFDKVTKGEIYKLYDYDISEGFTGTLHPYKGFYGTEGSDFSVNIDDSKLIYMGAFMRIKNALSVDYSISELDAMKSLLKSLQAYPGWTGIIAERIAELEGKKE